MRRGAAAAAAKKKKKLPAGAGFSRWNVRLGKQPCLLEANRLLNYFKRTTNFTGHFSRLNPFSPPCLSSLGHIAVKLLERCHFSLNCCCVRTVYVAVNVAASTSMVQLFFFLLICPNYPKDLRTSGAAHINGAKSLIFWRQILTTCPLTSGTTHLFGG